MDAVAHGGVGLDQVDAFLQAREVEVAEAIGGDGGQHFLSEYVIEGYRVQSRSGHCGGFVGGIGEDLKDVAHMAFDAIVAVIDLIGRT